MWILATGYWDDTGVWVDSDFWRDSPADVPATETPSRGGAGHGKRTPRYFRGKLVGTFTDEEFVEYLLAFLGAEVGAEEVKQSPAEEPKSRRRQRKLEIIEPEPIPPLMAEVLPDLEPQILALIEEASKRRQFNALVRALRKIREREEDEEHMIIALLH